MLRTGWLLALSLPFWLMAQSLGEQHLQQLQRQSPAGFRGADLAELEITDEYQDRHNGVTHLYLQQRYQGLAVQGATYSAHFGPDGRLLTAHNQLLADLDKRVNTLQPTLKPRQAVQAAATHLEVSPPVGLQPLEVGRGPEQTTVFAGGSLSVEPIPVQLSLQADAQGDLHLAWYLRIYEPGRQHWWSYWVDAQNGDILGRHDWVVHCSWGHHHKPFEQRDSGPIHLCAEALRQPRSTRSFQDGSAYLVLPYPVESPSHGSFQVVNEPADSLASPFGWHDINGQSGAEYTITRGNNVHALEDLDGTNDGNGFSPDGGNDLAFNFPYNPNGTPDENGPAAVVNLFYWNNLMHDIWYHLGFDEVAGNFQQNNYGRGGSGGDYVIADARDGSGFNNANFATPPDGFTPRMQMFIWNPSFTPSVTVTSPASIAGDYEGPEASFGPGLPPVPLTGELALMTSSGSSEACGPADTPSAISGKIALVDRGSCLFADKVRNAQNAGAIAVVVVNNNADPPFVMGGEDDGTISIPAVMVSRSDGNRFRNALQDGVVTLQLVRSELASGEDSDFDNGVIAHEYAHGISNRLTGGPGQAFGLTNEEQAGEGWSDWFGLVVTHRPGDTRTTPRGMATFLRRQPNDGLGIRPARYSTDMGVNPLTYDDVKQLSVPHGVGSVMATMLWDLYWDLVDLYGFDANLRDPEAGNVKAMRLVMDGLKLQPNSPGFVDVRDAILLADQVNYNGANQCLIWKAFARRGLGYSADQGSANDRSDGTEAFDLPPLCQEILFIANQTEARLVSPEDTVRYRIFWSNRTGAAVGGLSVEADLPTFLDNVVNLSDCAPTQTGTEVSFALDTLPDVFRDTCGLVTTVRSDAPRSTYTQLDSLEGSTNAYLRLSQAGTDDWRISSNEPRSGNQSFFVPNVGALNDQVLQIPGSYPVNAKTVFSFWHEYHTEAGWDGGLVEFQRAGSSEWEDMGPYFIFNGYNSNVGPNNPAGARPAFGGNSRRYLNSWADLSELAGETIQVRFRFVSDDNTFVEGWYVDDIGFLDAERFSSTACLRNADSIITCGVQAQQTFITVDPQGLVNLEETLAPDTEVRVFPNPAQNKLQVQLEQTQPASVQVYLENLMGQSLWRSQPVQGLRPSWQIDVSGYPTGMYLLRIQQGERVRVEKIRIE